MTQADLTLPSLILSIETWVIQYFRVDKLHLIRQYVHTNTLYLLKNFAYAVQYVQYPCTGVLAEPLVQGRGCQEWVGGEGEGVDDSSGPLVTWSRKSSATSGPFKGPAPGNRGAGLI